MTSYFVVVGVTPIACANSMAWYTRSNLQPPITDVYFITSWDKPEIPSPKGEENVQSVIELTRKNLEMLTPSALESITFHDNDIVWMPEEDLAIGVRCVAEGIMQRSADDESIVIDATGGRKTMSSSAILAGYLLQSSYKRTVTFSYYWIRRFKTDTLSKPAYELGIDEAETKLTGVDDLNEQIGKFKEKYKVSYDGTK